MGSKLEGEELTPHGLEERLALIAGTSSCLMAASVNPLYIKGIWGPYFGAMIDNMWLTEGNIPNQ